MNKKTLITVLGNNKKYILDSLFDQGSLSSYEILTTDPLTIRLDPINHWNSDWAHYAIRDNTLGGKTPKFYIAFADHQSFDVDQRMCAWSTSPDTDTWHDFDNVAATETDLEFYNDTAFPSGIIYIAALPLFPFSRVQRLVSSWKSNALVSKTTSSDDNLIISLATSRDAGDGSNRVAPALPFYGFKITSTAENTKNKAIFAGYNHPSESQGMRTFEGMLEWLLGGSKEANFLLDWFEIYCYPCVNPQGVWAGYFRSCPENTLLDHNRQWHQDVLECVTAFRAAMLADTGGTIEVGLDFHGSYLDDTFYADANDHTDELHVIFGQKVASLEPTFDIRTTSIEGQLHKYWLDTYSSRLSMAVETGNSYTKTLSDYITYGQRVGISLTKMLSDGRFTNGVPVGSREFNGTTDRIDWANVSNLAGSPITISAWIYLDRITGNQYLVHLHGAANAIGIIMSNNNASSGSLQLWREGSSADMYRLSVQGALTTGVWTNVIVTHDGTFDDYTKAKLYKNGIELGYHSQTPGANGNGEVAITGSWSIGGRISDDARNTDGKIAQVGVWDRVLTPEEITDLAAGYKLDEVAPTNLLFYFDGVTDSLANSITGGTDGTADGTTHVTGAGNGAPLVY